MAADVDWTAVQADYLAGMSQSKLAAKYGIPKGTINTRCIKGGWTRIQKSVTAKSQERLADKVAKIKADTQADKIKVIMDANDQLSVVLKKITDQLTMLENAPLKNLREMADLAKAISMTTDTMYKQYGLLTATQEHNQRMAEERLKMEREKLELEKAKADADDEGEDVEIRIITPEEDEAEGADAEEA